ncbi:MAG: 2-isopropylmalate synthase, partial [Thermoanaerobaculia bacterium]
MDETEDLIYDWNLQGSQPARPPRRVEFDDETLRDGLQSPSVTDPSLDEKIQILHFMNDIGIDNV